MNQGLCQFYAWWQTVLLNFAKDVKDIEAIQLLKLMQHMLNCLYIIVLYIYTRILLSGGKLASLNFLSDDIFILTLCSPRFNIFKM